MSSFPFAVEFQGNFLHTGTRLGACVQRLDISCLSPGTDTQMPHNLEPDGSSQDESNTPAHNAVLCEQRKSYQGDPKEQSSLTLFPFFQGTAETSLSWKGPTAPKGLAANS